MSRASASDRVFGLKVAEARMRLGLSQTRLGRSAGLTHPQVRLSRIELGESPATISEAVAIAIALGMSLDELVDGTGAPVECPRCAETARGLRRILDDCDAGGSPAVVHTFEESR